MRLAQGFGVMFLLCALLAAGVARADRLVTDLSERQIAITSSFQGTTLLIFGAVQQEGIFDGGLAENDVVIVVRGPETPVVVRKKDRVAGIWVNTDAVTFESVPGYYAVASTAPLADIVPAVLQERNAIGLENIHLDVSDAGDVADEEIAGFREAILRQSRRAELFVSNEGGVTLLAETLFRANLAFPANVPVGDYRVEAYLLKDGRIVSAQSSPLSINKIGIERSLFVMAHESAWAYGLLAILLAVVSGWVAGMVFRQR